jgi:hypothetical protein
MLYIYCIAMVHATHREETAPLRAATVAFCVGRVAFGIALLASPERIGAAWLGPDAERLPTQTALRGLGARDLALAGGAAWASLRNGDARSWLIATVAGDVADVAAALLARDDLPPRGRRGTLALAGGSALAGALLAWRHDR